MLHETLKQATLHQHAQLEQLMFVDKIMDGSLSFEEYKKILNTNYIVHAYIEENLFNSLSPHLQQELNINGRVKLPALQNDLREANLSIPVAVAENSFINHDNDAAQLGILYVLEGATLGGNVIVKRLKSNVHLAPYKLNFYYYQVYGDKLIENWKQFLKVLNTITADKYDAAILSANEMFVHFATFHALQA